MPARRLHLQYLSNEELAAIEETSYRLLNEVGISLQHSGATEMLRGLGCRVENGRVFIPPDVVRWGIEHVTPQKELYSLDGKYSVPLGDGASASTTAAVRRSFSIPRPASAPRDVAGPRDDDPPAGRAAQRR